MKPLESLDILRSSSAAANKTLVFPRSAGILSADRNRAALLRREQGGGEKSRAVETFCPEAEMEKIFVIPNACKSLDSKK
jgi:hypothetical protein